MGSYVDHMNCVCLPLVFAQPTVFYVKRFYSQTLSRVIINPQINYLVINQLKALSTNKNTKQLRLKQD